MCKLSIRAAYFLFCRRAWKIDNCIAKIKNQYKGKIKEVKS